MIQYNIPVELTPLNFKKYVSYTNEINSILAKFENLYKLFRTRQGYIFDGDFGLLKACANGFKVTIKGEDTYLDGRTMSNLISKKIDKGVGKLDWSANNIFEMATLFFLTIRNRAKLLNNSYEKLVMVNSILKSYHRNTIILTDNIEYAEDVTKLVNELFMEGYNENIAFPLYSGVTSVRLLDYNTNKFLQYKNGKDKLFGLKGLSDVFKSKLTDNSFYVAVNTRTISKYIKNVNFKMCIRVSSTAKLDYLINNSENLTVFNVYIKNLPSYEKDMENFRSRQKNEHISNSEVIWANFEDLANIRLK